MLDQILAYFSNSIFLGFESKSFYRLEVLQDVLTLLKELLACHLPAAKFPSKINIFGQQHFSMHKSGFILQANNQKKIYMIPCQEARFFYQIVAQRIHQLAVRVNTLQDESIIKGQAILHLNTKYQDLRSTIDLMKQEAKPRLQEILTRIFFLIAMLIFIVLIAIYDEQASQSAIKTNQIAGKLNWFYTSQQYKNRYFTSTIYSFHPDLNQLNRTIQQAPPFPQTSNQQNQHDDTTHFQTIKYDKPIDPLPPNIVYSSRFLRLIHITVCAQITAAFDMGFTIVLLIRSYNKL